MELKISFEGGYANNHQIPVVELSKFATSIQKISNYQLKNNSLNICLNNAEKGSFTIYLGAIAIGIASNLATDGIKKVYTKIKSYINHKDIKNNINNIRNLYEELYCLYSDLSKLDTFDTSYEIIMDNIQSINKHLETEIAILTSIKEIGSLIDSKSQSYKPNQIKFGLIKDNQLDNFNFDLDAKKEIEKLENISIQLKDIEIEGIINNLKRGNKPYFKIRTIDSTQFKIYTTNDEQSELSNFYRDQIKVKLKIKPIVILGSLSTTKEARLVSILK